MASLWQDLRFAARLLSKDRWFTLAAVVALSLGIGANAAVFTIVNAAILRGLPFDDADRIVVIGTRDGRGRDGGSSVKDYQDWQAASHSFSMLTSVVGTAFALGDDDHAAELYSGVYTRAAMFSVLREQVALGRVFTADDDRQGNPAMAILSSHVWQTRYAADPAVIGRPIRVNGLPATVIGVMPDGMKFPFNTDVWMSYSFVPPPVHASGREARYAMAIGRLADGVSVGAAAAEMATISANLAREYPDTNKDLTATVVPVFERFVGPQLKVVFWALMGAVAFVLLIACANVANLLMARATHRSREISVRVAIGASRARIVRQLLVESVLLSVVSGIVGLGLSILGIRWFDAAIADAGKPYWMTFTFDPSVFLFFAALCVATGIIFGLAPALQVSHTNVLGVLNEGGRSGAGGTRTRRWASALVVVQLTLTLVLLAGAGFMMRSFLGLYRMDLGMDTSRLLVAQMLIPTRKYPTPEDRAAFLRRVNDRLAATGEIVSGTTASHLPMGYGVERHLALEGQPDDERPPLVTLVEIAPRYFETLGVPLIRGRVFDETDGAPGRSNAIVNQRFVSMYFPNQDPIGRRMRLTTQQAAGPQMDWLTIVGVAPTVRQRNVQAPTPDPVVYVPHQQANTGVESQSRNASIIVRGRGDPLTLTPTLRQAIAAVDADMPLSNVRTMDNWLALLRWSSRVFGVVFAIFAGMALALAAVGLYGVTAYSVTQRTQEIGIRMALGAQPEQIRWLILRRGMAQLAVGLIVGLAGAYGVGRILQSNALLFDTSPGDPLTLLPIITLLAVVAIAACLLPVRRAARLDPIASLRFD